MAFTMGNCVTLEDTNGNRKLLKKRTEEKIDSVAALMDAFVAYKINKDLSKVLIICYHGMLRLSYNILEICHHCGKVSDLPVSNIRKM